MYGALCARSRRFAVLKRRDRLRQQRDRRAARQQVDQHRRHVDAEFGVAQHLTEPRLRREHVGIREHVPDAQVGERRVERRRHRAEAARASGWRPLGGRKSSGCASRRSSPGTRSAANAPSPCSASYSICVAPVLCRRKSVKRGAAWQATQLPDTVRRPAIGRLRLRNSVRPCNSSAPNTNGCVGWKSNPPEGVLGLRGHELQRALLRLLAHAAQQPAAVVEIAIRWRAAACGRWFTARNTSNGERLKLPSSSAENSRCSV